MPDLAQILEGCRAESEALARDLPTEQECMAVIRRAWDRLQDLGWKDIVYSPKDGTPFEVICAGDLEVREAFYAGDWPTGSWFVVCEGDAYPDMPLCFRLKSGGAA